jgi:hypothetical protein
MKTWLFIVIQACCTHVFAQPKFNTGEPFALGNISSVGNDYAWFGSANAANLSQVKSHNIQFHQVIPYGIVQLSTSELIAYTSINNHSGIAIQFAQNGFGLIEHNKYGIAYGLLITQQFSGGIKLNYHRWRQGEQYPSFQTISPELGLSFQLNKNTVIGSQVMLNISNKHEFESQLEAFNIGVKYKLDKQINLYSQITSTEVSQQVSMGMSYQIKEVLHIMLATGINPSLFSLGITYHKNPNWSLVIASQWQSTIGISPSIGFLYHWK